MGYVQINGEEEAEKLAKIFLSISQVLFVSISE